MSSETEQFFSANYLEAREKFLRLAQTHGFELEAHRNSQAQGPDGHDLYLDVATANLDGADRMLVLLSGTHGVEGYCGSGIQSALLGLGELSNLPEGLGLVLIHAVNPYGFAHDRRVNEGNIDLNRNFLDFAKEQPRDNGYANIHADLVPLSWSGESRQAADARLASYAKQQGPAAFQQAATGGQYTHADGIFYGGRRPSWSAVTVIDVIKALTAKVSKAAFVDFHTGLGPYGYGELIAAGYGAQVRRTFAFYSGYEVTDPEQGTSSSAPIQGTLAHGIERALPDVETFFIALEYGTQSMKQVMTALRADNWLYLHGDFADESAPQIKKQIRDAFYCDEAEWKNSVYARALDVVGTTIERLSAS